MIGSGDTLYHLATSAYVVESDTIAGNPGDDIAPGTPNSILKQAVIKKKGE